VPFRHFFTLQTPKAAHKSWFLHSKMEQKPTSATGYLERLFAEILFQNSDFSFFVTIQRGVFNLSRMKNLQKHFFQNSIFAS
jgi:hypothetical protein